METVTYVLCGVISLACGVLLMRGYVRGRRRLLLWSGLCFLSLSLSNFLIFVDLQILPMTDLYSLRLAVAAVATLMLVFGLIWESQ